MNLLREALLFASVNKVCLKSCVARPCPSALRYCCSCVLFESYSVRWGLGDGRATSCLQLPAC